MTRKVGIIGIGNVGSTLAHSLVLDGQVDTLVLIDQKKEKVQADALDFQDAMANSNYYTNILVNDYSVLKDAQVIVITLGDIRLQLNEDNDRFAELAFTHKAAIEVGKKIKEIGFQGVLVVVTNPVDVITSLLQEVTGLPKNQVIGTGTLLDSARMKRALAKELSIDSRSVSGYNLGEHGNSQFTAWSTVRVMGQPITELASEKGVDLDAIDQESKEGGHRVFWGKKYTNYGIASATQRLIIAILSDAHSELPVSNYYEPLSTYLSYPAIIGKKGVIEQVDLKLTSLEQEKLIASACFIKEKYQEYSTN